VYIIYSNIVKTIFGFYNYYNNYLFNYGHYFFGLGFLYEIQNITYITLLNTSPFVYKANYGYNNKLVNPCIIMHKERLI